MKNIYRAPELIFDKVRISAGNLLGDEGNGFCALMKGFQTECIAPGVIPGSASVAAPPR